MHLVVVATHGHIQPLRMGGDAVRQASKVSVVGVLIQAIIHQLLEYVRHYRCQRADLDKRSA